jgi:hypothetical protein
VNYKNRMVPFMPGRRAVDKEHAFFAIFSTMIGAVEIARLLPDPAIREKMLGVRGIFSWAVSDLLIMRRQGEAWKGLARIRDDWPLKMYKCREGCKKSQKSGVTQVE